MTVGYAAFQTNLDIKGTSKVSSNWNILITNVIESKKGGEGESAKEPTWEALTASVEANVYQKGDYVEYEVTVENRGTLDAKLEGIEEKIIGENEAIKISFLGYTKGQKLEKGNSQIIKVRIEYNPEFNGTPEIGSTKISVDLNYTQNNDYQNGEDGEIISPERYLVTYDCTSNGGKSCTKYNEYLKEGEQVNLTEAAEKEGYTFVGWNTNKDSEEGLTQLEMQNEDIILYAIFKDITPPTIPTYIAYHQNEDDRYISGTWTSEEVHTKISSSDNGSGISKFQLMYTSSTVHETNKWLDLELALGGGLKVDGNKAYGVENWQLYNREAVAYFRAVDKAGNVSEKSEPYNLKYNLSIPTYIAYYASEGEESKYESGTWTNKYVHTKIISKDSTTTKIQISGDEGKTWYDLAFGQSNGIQKSGNIVYGIEEWTLKNRDDTRIFRAVNSSGKTSPTSKIFNIKYDLDKPILSISTSTTSQSIDVVIDAQAQSGISKYEYSKDNGATWIDGGTNNIYTFTNLDQGTAYPIKVRVTSKIGKQTTSEVTTVTTNTLKTPIFTDGNLETTITYEEGCGDTLTCTYKYNDKEEVEVTSKTVLVPITEAGNIVAKVTDGKNIENSTHMVLYNDLYVSNSGNDNTGYGTKEKPYATLNKAYSMTSESASIKVMNNITANETTTFNQNKNITLTSYTENNTNNSIVRGNALTEAALNITSGTLNLENIIIDGNNVEALSSLIVLNGDDVYCNFNEGSIVQNGVNTQKDNSSNSGGGVRFVKGHLIINGGYVINNKAVWGGGILKNGPSTNPIIINSGKISYNEGTYGGGINGKIEMTGGEISYNKTTGNGGGGVISGIIKGGSIVNNESLAGAGMIVFHSTLEITGGIISNNTATGNAGGLLVGEQATVMMNGGLISNNVAEKGAGVFVQYNSVLFTINDGVIKNNKGNVSDGGIFATDITKYNYKKGTICGNTPTNSYETHTTCPS
ncbi:MAG: InlB B-repeat-containing protein [Bacilli bacterium]|nr:InlB B-repeat-containing protein [Bacilli bacterium]